MVFDVTGLVNSELVNVTYVTQARAVSSSNGACQRVRPPLPTVELHPSSDSSTGPQTGQVLLSTNHHLICGVNTDIKRKKKKEIP